MKEFRVNQTVLVQKIIIAETEEEATKEFEEQLDKECEIETFSTNWSEIRVISLEQNKKDHTESIKEEEYRDEYCKM